MKVVLCFNPDVLFSVDDCECGGLVGALGWGR